MYSEHENYTSYTFKVSSLNVIPSFSPKIKNYLTQKANTMQVKIYDSYQKTITLPDSNLVVNKFLVVKPQKRPYAYTTGKIQYDDFRSLVSIEFLVGFTDDIVFSPWTERVTVYKNDDETLDEKIEKRLNHIRDNERVSIGTYNERVAEVQGFYSYDDANILVTDRIDFFSNIRGKIRLFADFKIESKLLNGNFYNVEIPCRQEGNSLILDYFGCDLLKQINLYSFDTISLLDAADVYSFKTSILEGKTTKYQYRFGLSITISKWMVDYTQGDYPFEFV